MARTWKKSSKRQLNKGTSCLTDIIRSLNSRMQNKHVTERALVGSIIVSMFLWGLSWPSAKVLTGYCTAFNFAVYRYIIVAISLALMLLVFKVKFTIKKEGILAVIMSGILLGFYSYFFFKGLKVGAAGAGGVLVTTLNPLIAYTIGIILTRRLPSKNESIGLVLGLAAGCILLKIWDNSGTLLDSGNVYFLLCALSWAAMSKFTAKGAKYGASLSFSFWQYLVTLACLLPLIDVHEFSTVAEIKGFVFWGNLFFSSAIVTALATTMYFYATTRLGAEKASSFIFMVPLGAAVSSWIILGEKILPHTAIGGVLGILAVYMINIKKQKPKTIA